MYFIAIFFICLGTFTFNIKATKLENDKPNNLYEVFLYSFDDCNKAKIFDISIWSPKFIPFNLTILLCIKNFFIDRSNFYSDANVFVP